MLKLARSLEEVFHGELNQTGRHGVLGNRAEGRRPQSRAGIRELRVVQGVVEYQAQCQHGGWGADRPVSARGTTYRNHGSVTHWRGIYDNHGRVMVTMSFNSDIADSREWADDPRYPEKYSALGIRIGVNYVVNAMTH
jgi:hypothetical protein